MFLKSTNLPTIDKYPYSFDDLRKDNPNTCFPVDFFSENNPDLVDYHIYMTTLMKTITTQSLNMKIPIII